LERTGVLMKKKGLLNLFAMILLAGLLVSSYFPVRAQTGAVVIRVTPAQLQLAVGHTADVAVEIVNTPPIYGVEFRLLFDPNVVEVVDLEPNLYGNQIALGTFLDPGFVMFNRVNNISGEVYFAMTQLNPSQPKSGSGNLAVIRLRGKQSSASIPLTLEIAKVAQRDGTILTTSPQSGAVVIQSLSSGPTNTPIPSQGAGTPMPTLTPTIPSTSQATVPSYFLPTATQDRLLSTSQPPDFGQPTLTPAASRLTEQPVQPPAQPAGSPQPVEKLITVVVPQPVLGSENSTPTPVDIAAIQTAAVRTALAQAASGVTPTPSRSVAGMPTLSPTPAGSDAGGFGDAPVALAGFLAGGAGVCLAAGGILIGLAAIVFVVRSRRAK
jgi:hypothetical protein